jgi:tripartite-type tricarboxylate transporter receptor subunit TctC
MINRRHLLAASATALAPALLPRLARADTWPSRFVRLIVPFPPGGGTDSVGRILSAKLSEIWGQQLVIENRGGAGSNLGSEAGARSDPDGYTILFAALPIAINKFIYRSLNYDVVADFAPITLLCTFPNLLVVANSSPAKSVADLIAYGKQNPGAMTFGSSGIGTSPHLSGELFKRMAGIEMTHVPYRGAGPAINDLLPGRLTMMFNTAGSLMPYVKSGQVRGLASSAAKRFFGAPDMPTVAESGLPGFDVTSWYALFAPIKTPPEIVRKINADTVTALKDAVVRQRFENLGLEIVGSTPEELARFVNSEIAKWGPVIKAAGISAQ